MFRLRRSSGLMVVGRRGYSSGNSKPTGTPGSASNASAGGDILKSYFEKVGQALKDTSRASNTGRSIAKEFKPVFDKEGTAAKGKSKSAGSLLEAYGDIRSSNTSKRKQLVLEDVKPLDVLPNYYGVSNDDSVNIRQREITSSFLSQIESEKEDRAKRSAYQEPRVDSDRQNFGPKRYTMDGPWRAHIRPVPQVDDSHNEEWRKDMLKNASLALGHNAFLSIKDKDVMLQRLARINLQDQGWMLGETMQQEAAAAAKKAAADAAKKKAIAVEDDDEDEYEDEDVEETVQHKN